MQTKEPVRLTPELRSLCGRLATERVRAQAWALAATLRREALERLQAGESPAVIVSELQSAIAAGSV